MTLTPTEGSGARPAPPLDLLRLRSATKAYLAILADSLPAIEAMAAAADPPELVLTPEVSAPVHDLVEAARAAIDVEDAPGTPAAIERLIAAVLDDPVHEARLEVTSMPSGDRALARSPFRSDSTSA